MKTKVDFLQFLRPSGRQNIITIGLDADVAVNVAAIRESGCRLTAEVLMNEKCSFCIEEPDLGDFDQVICDNGPQVPVKITEMLLRFSKSAFDAWKQEMTEPEPINPNV